MLYSVILLKLLLATLIGGQIGFEREFREKAAGFRTLILICTGATLFTILSFEFGGDRDPVRIAASIVSGIGFLGTGAILRDGNHVSGLTTASTIWIVAALGMGIGGEFYFLTGVFSIIVLITLWTFPFLDKWIHNIRHIQNYSIAFPKSPEKLKSLEAMIKDLKDAD